MTVETILIVLLIIFMIFAVTLQVHEYKHIKSIENKLVDIILENYEELQIVEFMDNESLIEMIYVQAKKLDVKEIAYVHSILNSERRHMYAYRISQKVTKGYKDAKSKHDA